MSKPREILGELAGYASMCWEPRPKGVFDSDEATKGVNQALSALSESILSVEEIEKAVPLYYFMFLFIPFIGVYGGREKIAQAIHKAIKENLSAT